jgi:hypothetical protein
MTSFYEKGFEVTSHRKIALKYIKSYFFPDVLTWAALASFLFLQEIPLPILFCFRFFYLPNQCKQIDQLIIRNDFLKGNLKILVLFSRILYLNHFLTCFWLYITLSGAGFWGS